MNKKEAWNKFQATGKVEDYLAYVKVKDEQNGEEI